MGTPNARACESDSAREDGVTMTVGHPLPFARALFGDLLGTYVVRARGRNARLFVEVLARYPRSACGRAVAGPMPHVDLFMMKKQLRTLKAFAERTA